MKGIICMKDKGMGWENKKINKENNNHSLIPSNKRVKTAGFTHFRLIIQNQRKVSVQIRNCPWVQGQGCYQQE